MARKISASNPDPRVLVTWVKKTCRLSSQAICSPSGQAGWGLVQAGGRSGVAIWDIDRSQVLRAGLGGAVLGGAAGGLLRGASDLAKNSCTASTMLNVGKLVLALDGTQRGISRTITNYNEGNYYSLGASAITSMASFAFAGRSGMKAAHGTCFVAGTPVVAVSSHVAQVQLAVEPASGSGGPGWSVAYVGIFAGLTASVAARGAARRQRRRREVLEREAREAVFGEAERHRRRRSGILAESLLEDVRWFEQDIPKGSDKTFDVVFGRDQWAAAVSEAVIAMDDFPDSSTELDTRPARPVAGTPESARPAVRAASGPCVLAGTEYASEETLRSPAGAEKASAIAASPSPRSAHDDAGRLAAGKSRRLPNAACGRNRSRLGLRPDPVGTESQPTKMRAPCAHVTTEDSNPRPNRPRASRCGPCLWNAASILSLIVALVCLALIPPFGGKSMVDPEPTKLTANTGRPSLPTIPIERRRPGDWALAHNPELTDEERWAAEHDEFGPVEAPDDWRLVSLRMEKPDGGDLQIELLRPLDWLDWYEVQVGAEIDLDLEELGADGPATVLAIQRCPQILPRPGPGYQLVTGRFAHSSAEVLDLVLIDAQGETTAIGVTANHPFWSADQQAFVLAGDLSTVREITVQCPLAPRGRGQGEGSESASVISRTVLTPGTCLQPATDDSIQVASLTPPPRPRTRVQHRSGCGTRVPC